jgi:hypothetical protein
MKPAFLAGLASLSFLTAPLARTSDELRVVYRAGTEVIFETHEWRTFEVKDVTTETNGQEEPEEDSQPSEREDRVIRFTTWLDEVADGRPVGARRRFEELTRTWAAGEMEEEEEGELSGRTLLLSGSADGDEVAARLPEDDEGPEVDDAYLLNHRMAVELERCFPGRAVDVGDEWKLDEEDVRAILGVDRNEPRYFESETHEEGEINLALREGFEVSGSVEYERREEVEGVACAVLLIKLRGEVSGADFDPPADGQEGTESFGKVSMSMESERRLTFALEAGRPVTGRGEWKGEMTVAFLKSNEDAGVASEKNMVMDVGGGFEQSWRYSEER